MKDLPILLEHTSLPLHACWGTTSFASHCQTAPEPESRWAVARTRRPARSPDFNPLEFWMWGHLKSFVYSAPINGLRGITATRRECLPGDSSETKNSRQSAHLCAPKSWKLCWNAWEPHKSICCRDHRNIARTSAGAGFWACVDRDFSAHLNEYF
jgi:hypothetical protein